MRVVQATREHFAAQGIETRVERSTDASGSGDMATIIVRPTNDDNARSIVVIKAYGFRSIQNVLRRLRTRRLQADFIEIMACVRRRFLSPHAHRSFSFSQAAASMAAASFERRLLMATMPRTQPIRTLKPPNFNERSPSTNRSTTRPTERRSSPPLARFWSVGALRTQTASAILSPMWSRLPNFRQTQSPLSNGSETTIQVFAHIQIFIIIKQNCDSAWATKRERLPIERTDFCT